MLKRASRMGRNKQFDRAFKLGQSFYGKFIGLKVVDNDEGVTHFGIMISTKVSKKAVVRNTFKRRIRAILAEELPKMKPGKDLVVIVLPLILDKKFEEIKIFLQTGLKKLNLYK